MEDMEEGLIHQEIVMRVDLDMEELILFGVLGVVVLQQVTPTILDMVGADMEVAEVAGAERFFIVLH